MKKICQLIKALFLLLLVSFAKPVFAKLPDQILTIGTGANSGNYFAVGKSFCNFVNQNISDKSIKCIIRTTGASVENQKLVLNDKTTMGIAQADSFINLPEGNKFRMVLRLYLEPVFIVSSKTSDARSFNDLLLQPRINIGSPFSGENRTAKMLMLEKNWNKNNLLEAGRYEIFSLLCRGSVDITFLVGSHPNSFVSDILSRCDARLLPIEKDFISSFSEKYKVFFPFVIPANSYPNQNAEINTIAVEAILFASEDTSEELVYKSLKAIFQDFTSLQNSNAVFKKANLKDFFENNTTLPLHKGSEKFLKEVELKKN